MVNVPLFKSSCYFTRTPKRIVIFCSLLFMHHIFATRSLFSLFLVVCLSQVCRNSSVKNSCPLHNKEEEFKSKHTHYIYIYYRERRVGVQIRFPPSSSLFLFVNIYQSERRRRCLCFCDWFPFFLLLSRESLCINSPLLLLRRLSLIHIWRCRRRG